MKTEVEVNNEMLSWAINRAGYKMPQFAEEFPKILDWLDGNKKPTVKQLEKFSKKVFLPFGYLFLPKPPVEKLPIPYFRTDSSQNDTISINVLDTIRLMQQRQDWLRNYLKDNQTEKLKFVGSYANNKNVKAIVSDIRATLELTETWANEFKNWQVAQDHLIERIESKGIIISFNGIVGNNTHRLIPVTDCRGFVLVDEFAPFMFVNNSDFKSAQMFTVMHELAHIWTGKSAGFDFRKLQPADDTIEILCDKVAAEFLVPESIFGIAWNQMPNNYDHLSRRFKVSKIVIARRALDTGRINKKQFFDFYNDYSKRELTKKEKQSSGGDFYLTTKKRISMNFATHIHRAVKSGELLYRDAYKLTGLKGDTFETFFSKSF